MVVWELAEYVGQSFNYFFKKAIYNVIYTVSMSILSDKNPGMNDDIKTMVGRFRFCVL